MTNLTLSDRNKFSFTCPIFDSEVSFRSCATLRERVYAGTRPEVRRGCQACMSAGKCPVAVIVSDFSFNRADRHGGSFASADPVKGKLTASVLDRVTPQMVPSWTISQFGCSTAEVKLIESANDRIAAQLKSAPKSANYKPRPGLAPDKRKSVAQSKPKEKETVVNAAITGDMSAAINEKAS